MFSKLPGGLRAIGTRTRKAFHPGQVNEGDRIVEPRRLGQARPATDLPAQDGYLMPQREDLGHQRFVTADQQSQSGEQAITPQIQQPYDHADDGQPD